MNVRKTFKVGNSLVVSIPQEYVKSLGIKEGDPLIIEPWEHGFIVKTFGAVGKESKIPSGKSPVERLLEKYGFVVEEFSS
ncbi:AbrB/MazE/SpoVT family DNA-binding domain-containing protein [Carboxydothermus ferrireducens]|uniref:Addiction module antidote n=1 Tax=Carboxydothermus ferrireducens DSM 11255 TaxID=1119529 RepID=A0ABX2R828_9THEO|nr:AbrB/MazE/SpoVT family DNA-binding domain-containing protein [Carboxydothermus ferrireducens]NYE57331.1 putative addiction module antidote [Carboxydothermus ferrireducens DSM 11255]